jgi:hypothetical protein
MELGRGWATDYGKNRFDVRADETDLLRILAEAGFENPGKAAAAMKSSDVMQALDAELMQYVHFTLSKHEKPKAAEHLARMREFRAERDAILARYRPEPDAEPVPA